ncbi:MAG: prolipoprotein diacylglyceryl transferase [Actinomycetota bacterium]|nr:prolipoprotein diacylglyceryl transferase [Actinomycetota bacterium]
MELIAAFGWPVLDRIRLGPVAISPHGIGIAAGYLVGAMLMVREGRRRGLDEDHVGSMLLWALLGAIVGARFFYVVGHFREFGSFVEMLQVWRGGISLLGGIAGALIFAYPLMRRYRYRFFQVMDPAAVFLPLGIVIGRIGDLVIGDHIGKPTSFFMGWQYQGGNLPGYVCVGESTVSVCTTTLADGTTQTIRYGDLVHQTALYDFFIALGLFALLWVMNRKPRREGVLALTFAILYGAGRVVTDFLRVDKTYFGLTGSQITSIVVILLAMATLVRFAMRPLPAGGPSDGLGDRERGEPPWASDAPSTAFVPPRDPTR